jgi:hypothetical protein
LGKSLWEVRGTTYANCWKNLLIINDTGFKTKDYQKILQLTGKKSTSKDCEMHLRTDEGDPGYQNLTGRNNNGYSCFCGRSF